jgi:outer membrane receptor protein involved in Fe transport
VLGQATNFSGDPLPFTPKWSGNVNVEYRARLANGGAPFIGFSVNARTKTDAVPGASKISYVPDPPRCQHCTLGSGRHQSFVIDGYATVDGRIGYEAPDGAWRIMVWGKNIFNKYYWTTVIASTDTASRMAGRPVTYGVTVGFKIR